MALRDPKEEIREASVEALRVCLRDIAKRGRDWRVACYSKLFLEAQAGFLARKASVPSTHGSLLCIGELLNISPPDYMADRFKDTAEYVLRYRDNGNALIVRTVISLIPRLAGQCFHTPLCCGCACALTGSVCARRCDAACSTLQLLSWGRGVPSRPVTSRRSLTSRWLPRSAPPCPTCPCPMSPALSPHSFSRNYLSMCLDYLIEQMKVRRLGSDAACACRCAVGDGMAAPSGGCFSYA